MAVQEPDGTTTASLASKVSRKWRATVRASARYPLLNAGCPQQVWFSGKSTWHPARSSTSAIAMPTCGKSWSTMQVTNSDTRLPMQ
jgi:hypothetical protein